MIPRLRRFSRRNVEEISGDRILRLYGAALAFVHLLTFVFVFYHFYHTRGVNLLYGTEVSYARMAGLMKAPAMFAFYVVGLAAVMFHFANGLWGFFISWGVTVGPRSRAVSGALCSAVGVTLFVIGVNSLVHLIK